MPDTASSTPPPGTAVRPKPPGASTTILGTIEHTAVNVARTVESGFTTVVDTVSGAIQAVDVSKLFESLTPALKAELVAQVGPALTAGEKSLADVLTAAHYTSLVKLLGTLDVAAVQAWLHTLPVSLAVAAGVTAP